MQKIESIIPLEGESFDELVYRAALSYASNGIPVIPLRKGEKKLPEGDGLNYASASTKVKTITKWFGPDGKYRGHNIGMVCGRAGGVMALDVDSKSKKGTTGLEELDKILSDENNQIPDGPKQITPTGGVHYLYRWWDGATSSSDKIAPGLDTRGGDQDRYTGHIVVYPSVIDGKQYYWEEIGEIPEPPEWLVNKMGSGRATRQSALPIKVDDELRTPVSEVPCEIPSNQIIRMMSYIDPDDLSYEDWVKIGMVLKNVMGDDGYEIWDNWSEQGSRRRNGECRIRWGTFKEKEDGGAGFGTLVYFAREGGWAPVSGDVMWNNMAVMVEERVMAMNSRFAVLRIGKTVMIATFDKNAPDVSVGFLMPGSFSLMVANEIIWIEKKKYPMSEIWISDSRRREYYEMGIYPNNDNPPGVLNLWNGYAVEESNNGSCEKYLAHMKNIICNENEAIYEWLLDWMADCVQDARQLKGSCIVLRGVEGCGKGIWANTFGELFGKHYTHLIDSERLTTRFNSFTSDSIIIFADEVLFPGDRKAANILKGLITEEKIVREAKGVDQVYVHNLNHVIISSNEDWVVPAGPQSRRYLVLSVSKLMANNRAYFTAIVDEMNNGGREALLHLLKNRKITNDLRYAPVTKALVEQRKISNRHDTLWNFLLESVERQFFTTVDSSAQVGDDLSVWPKTLNKFELFSEYRNYCTTARASTFDIMSLAVFSMRIESYGFVTSGKNLEVPSLDHLKAHLNEIIGEQK